MVYAYFYVSESYVDVNRCSIVVPDEMRCHDHIIIVIVTNDQVRDIEIQEILGCVPESDLLYAPLDEDSINAAI